MIEIDCSINSFNEKLEGTIYLPSKNGKFPVVLMIHGSGPLDRNENNKGAELNIFNTLAKELAKNGIASLRYDKRGCGKSSGEYYETGHFDLVNDALSCYDALENYELFDKEKKYVLGHSEGTIIAAQLNLKRNDIKGIINLCPFIDSLEEILKKQAKTIKHELDTSKDFFGKLIKTYYKVFGGSIISSQDKLIEKIKNSSKDNFYHFFEKVEAKWYREILTVNPLEIYKELNSPMLIIAGQKDLQCEPKDARAIKLVSNVACEVHVIDNLTHILRYDYSEPRVDNYINLLDKPVEKEVLDLIVDWID